MHVLLAFVGHSRSGKDELYQELHRQDFLTERRISIVRKTTTELLAHLLDELHIEASTARRKQLAAALNNGMEDGVISAAVIRDIISCKVDLGVFESIRYPIDLPQVRAIKPNLIIEVTATQEVRYNRYMKYGRKPGDRDISFDEFKAGELGETERHISALGKEADVTISNNGTLAEFQEKCRALFRDHVWPFFEV